MPGVIQSQFTSDLDRISETNHGRSVGDAVKRTGLSTMALARADSEANLAWGVVVFIEDDDHFEVAVSQGTVFNWTAHGLGSLRSLGYLSQATDGLIGSKPSSGLLQALVRVISDNEVELLDPNRVEAL